MKFNKDVTLDQMAAVAKGFIEAFGEELGIESVEIAETGIKVNKEGKTDVEYDLLAIEAGTIREILEDKILISALTREGFVNKKFTDFMGAMKVAELLASENCSACEGCDCGTELDIEQILVFNEKKFVGIMQKDKKRREEFLNNIKDVETREEQRANDKLVSGYTITREEFLANATGEESK